MLKNIYLKIVVLFISQKNQNLNNTHHNGSKNIGLHDYKILTNVLIYLSTYKSK